MEADNRTDFVADSIRTSPNCEKIKASATVAKTSKKLITKDMLIGDIVVKYPNAVQVLIENGFHCIGCSVSPYETLEQGGAMHGWDEEQFRGIMDAMNRIAEAEEKAQRAAEKKKGKK